MQENLTNIAVQLLGYCKRCNFTLQRLASSNRWRLMRAGLYMIFSVLFLISAWHGWFYYGEDKAAWFARSGAVSALFAGMSEALLAVYGFGAIFIGTGEGVDCTFRKNNSFVINIFQATSAILMAVGTMVWAYGDILYLSYSG